MDRYLEATVAVEISDEQLANAKYKFPLQTPTSKRNITTVLFSHEHFPSDAAALCVPQASGVQYTKLL
jgi:asparagine synthase (glutamine-hydrolysing)